VRLDIERLARYARRFGLGAATGIDLPNEVAGLVPDAAWKHRARGLPWYPGETVSVAIGQGQMLVTPLQLARLVSVVAGDGRLVTPKLVTHRGQQPREGPPPRPLGLAPETLAAIREGLCAAVAGGGTAWRARLPDVAVCGKTGSAQVVARDLTEAGDAPEALRAHAWFAGYAPAEDPRIAVAVLVEHGESGGVAAAPVAREIIAAYLSGEPPEDSRLAQGRPRPDEAL
jgi:penicillin-binding protein 2